MKASQVLSTAEYTGVDVGGPGTPPAFELRPPTMEDNRMLLDLYAESRAAELAMVPWSEERKREFILSQFTTRIRAYHQQCPGLEHSIVLRNGSPVGTLMTWRTLRELRIVDVALIPAERNKGLGTSLLLPLLREAEAGGCIVSLHVDVGSPAQRLYERLGFKVTAHLGFHIRMEWESVVP